MQLRKTWNANHKRNQNKTVQTQKNPLPENTCTFKVQLFNQPWMVTYKYTKSKKLQLYLEVQNWYFITWYKRIQKEIKLEHCKDSQSKGKNGTLGKKHRGNKEMWWTEAHSERHTEKERETVIRGKQRKCIQTEQQVQTLCGSRSIGKLGPNVGATSRF